MSRLSPLIVVVGATASGKTALALELAKKFDGEIVCADSRTVYKGLDIGTAKPTVAEQALVSHHLLDVVDPSQHFSVVDFKVRAENAIADIGDRDRLPIMVGGSGLYVDAVLFDYSFSASSAARDVRNSRHAHPDSEHSKASLREQTFVVGLDVDSDILKQRINQRIDNMIKTGLVDEVKWLMQTHPGSKSLDSTGYKAFAGYINGSITLDDAKQLFARNDYQLARRQRNWFRRNKSIHWASDQEEAVAIVTTLLNKKQ